MNLNTPEKLTEWFKKELLKADKIKDVHKCALRKMEILYKLKNILKKI